MVVKRPSNPEQVSWQLSRSRLHWWEVFRTAAVGLRTRKLRALLSVLGISIGIASMVAVLGLSESSKSDLLAQLDRLGTNLLTVSAGTGFGRGSGELPVEAEGMIERIGPVQSTSMVSAVNGAAVYKNDLVSVSETGGMTVQAVSIDLLETLGGSVAEGRFLDPASSAYPNVVLGSVTAERLGISDLDPVPRIWLGEQWFTVIGILHQFELSPNLDRAALIGLGTAADHLDNENIPNTIYIRTEPAWVEEVEAVLAATANPQTPEEVEVSRPSDALEAREAADDAYTALFLGLGAVALLVGGVGVANVMVISVLERRSEIGLRRALGATRPQIAIQFLGEALMLSVLGGVGGVLVGVGATWSWASYRGWGTLIPPWTMAAALAAGILIGALAGFYPAIRASRMSPTEALRTT